MSIHPPIYPFIHPSIHPSTHLPFIHPSTSTHRDAAAREGGVVRQGQGHFQGWVHALAQLPHPVVGLSVDGGGEGGWVEWVVLSEERGTDG
jgi:hypothetical protein